MSKLLIPLLVLALITSSCGFFRGTITRPKTNRMFGYLIGANAPGDVTVVELDPTTGLFKSEIVNSNAWTPNGQIIEASADGRFIYVSTGVNASISVLQFNPITSKLSFVQIIAAGAFANEVSLSPNGKFLYCGTNTNPSSVFIYSVDQTTGMLTNIGVAAVGGQFMRGRFGYGLGGTNIYTTDRNAGLIYQYSIAANGLISPLAPASITSGFGFSTIAALVDPQGKFEFTTSYFNNLIVSNQVNSDGTLTSIGTFTATGVTSIDDMEVSKDGNCIFAASWASVAVFGMQINRSNGNLAFVNSAPAGGLQTIHVSVDPSNKFLYSVDASTSNELVGYSINPATCSVARLSGFPVSLSGTNYNGIVVRSVQY
jgi:6-phosphogluconolactonase (cycloisomerase 2 family)